MRHRIPRLDWIEKVLGDSAEGREPVAPPVLRLVSGAATAPGQGAVELPAALPAVRVRRSGGPLQRRPKAGG
jgi:hypothetical protein